MRRKPVARRPGVALTLRRHPRWRSGLAVALGLLSGGAVVSTVQHADDARAAWGHPTSVLVATRDLAAGDALDASNTALVAQPRPLVPDGALHALPTDGRLVEPVYEGEVVRRERLAPGALSAVAARIPHGSRAMAIPVEPGTTPPMAVGDRVDVVVALAPEVAGGGPPGFALATDVPVVDVSDAAITVAVPRDAAPRVAVAFSQGAVTLTLVGAG